MDNYEVYYPKFLNLFQGREDVIAQQKDSGGYSPLRGEKLSKDYIFKHLEGFTTIGQYLLTKENKCHYLCIDIDTDKGNLSEYNFKDFYTKVKYLGEDFLKYVNYFIKEFGLTKSNMLFEDSGGRGMHLWIFFDRSIDGFILRKLDYLINSSIKPNYANYEFFPKQSIAEDLGNLIKLPLGIHNKYNRRSFFFIYEFDKFNLFESIESNLEHLLSIQHISSQLIIDKVGSISIPSIATKPREINFSNEEGRIKYEGDPSDFINSCRGLSKLYSKAIQQNKLTRKEAFYYASSLLSIENSDGIIKATLKKSYQDEFNEKLTQNELDKIKKLIPVSCLKMYENSICPGYCSQDILIKFKDGTYKSKNPASVLLRPRIKEKVIPQGNLKDSIIKIANIELAFIKLKKYGNQGTLFFDFIEFREFESNLNINCRLISELLKNNNPIPVEGFRIFEYPKKINNDQEIIYRKLTYSPIYDQIITQSIFNYAGIILDNQVSPSSIGYRIDKSENSDNIFEDWHDLYPTYRSKILKCLSNEKAKYYIYCDIEQFYDKINHEVLISQIKPYLDDFSFEIIKKHISSYNFDENQKGFGLPQGPAYARVLANFYLKHFDQLCDDITQFYFRYVDDIFLFFSTEQEAIAGLERITKFISENLGLGFSKSVGKEAFIRETVPNRNEILKKFQQAWYMQKNEFRQLEGSTIKTIQSFYDKIDHKIGHEIKEIEDLNNDLYSFIYLTSDFLHFGISSELKNLLIKCIPYLVKEKQFFPKDAKQVFRWIFKGRLFNSDGLQELFISLHDTHKIIFLFELRMFVINHKLYDDLYGQILNESLSSDNSQLKALSMNLLHSEGRIDFANVVILQTDLENELFLKYLPFDVESLKIIRENYNIIKNSERSILCKKKIIMLFSKKYNINPEYSDSLKIEDILKDNSSLFIPEVCDLFIQSRDNDSQWAFIQNKLISDNSRFKSFYLDLMKELSINYYKDASEIVLQNQFNLYSNIKDVELKEVLINSIKGIRPIEKALKILKKSDNSDYFKNEKTDKYEEVINWNSIQNMIDCNIDDFIRIINDLSAKNILPDLLCNYNSSKSTINIKYNIDQRRLVPYSDATQITIDSILALELELYKNSNYFFDQLHRCPLISEDNLFYDILEKSLVLKSFGSTFDQSHVIRDRSYNITFSKSIPQMLGSLIKFKFFYENIELTNLEGNRLFLDYFKKRLLDDTPISYNRLNYLNQKVSSINMHNERERLELYFFERFKGHLVKSHYEKITWYSIISTYYAILCIAKKNKLIPSYNRLAITYTYSFKNLTCLSRILWKFQVLYLKSESKEYDVNIIKLFQLFNLFSVLTIELIAFSKVVIKNKIVLTIANSKKIKYNNFEYELKIDELQRLQNLFDPVNIDETVLRNHSLTSIWISVLLRIFEIQDSEDILVLIKNKSFKRQNEAISFFQLLISIEKDTYQIGNELSNQMTRNQDFNSDISMDQTIEKLVKSLSLLGTMRNSLANYKRVHTKRDSYTNMVLNNPKNFFKFPLSQSEELYQKNRKTIDIRGGEIISIIIPSNNILELNKQISKVSFRIFVIPLLIGIWILLSIVSFQNIKSIWLNLFILIVLFIGGYLLEKFLDKWKLLDKITKL